MKIFHQARLSHREIKVVVGFLAISALGILAIIQNTKTVYPADPTTYGVPDTIAGYTVLAVKTSDQVPCMPPEMLQIILQASQPDINSFLSTSRPGDIQRELNQLPISSTFKWQVHIVAPEITKEQAQQDDETLKAFVQEHGCTRNEPIILITNTPVP